MAINIGTNFAYHGKLPNFDRDKFKTKDAMMAFDENSIDEGHLSYCEEDGNVYQYKSANTADATTGKWRLFKTEADATLNGTSTNAIQNKAVFDALKVKADAVALAAYQPKYKADYVAKADLSELPITKGILDLNGHSINASFSNQDGELTIQNGTILKIAEINDALNIINCTIKSDYVRTTLIDCHITFNNSNIERLGIADNIFCFIFNSNVGYLACDCKAINIYNSTVNELTCCSDGYKIVVISNSRISTINYDPISQPKNDGIIYLYNCVFEALDLDSYPRNIDVELYSCCDYINDVTYINGYYNKTDGLRERAYTTIIENGNDLAPTSDAVYKALADYQPKYNADYVATSDFDYSELPNDITTIDLNGYTMNVSVDNTIVHEYCYNGSINVTSNQVTLDGSCNNVSIYSEDAEFCKNGEGVVFTNCNLVQITIDVDCECENSYISSCVIKSFYAINSSLLGWCTFVVPNYDEGNFVNSVIDGVLYHKCAIKNNKPIETGYESNIDSPTISGNAPSCEAVTTKLANYATKTELNSKADVSELDNYTTTATTDAMSADITSLMNEVFVLTASASVTPNIAEAGTSKAVNVSVDAKLGKGRTQVDEITIDGTKYTGEIPYTHSATATTTHTYNITVKKGTKTADASATINFYNASYYGVVDASKTSLTATEVKALKTKEVKSGKSGERTFNLTSQKACIAYPQSFGAAASIKDANGFDYLASYTRSEVTIDSVVYYVYLLSSPTTITDFKQIIN